MDPLVSEFQKTYGAQGFAVVGVSMDESGDLVDKLKPLECGEATRG